MNEQWEIEEQDYNGTYRPVIFTSSTGFKILLKGKLGCLAALRKLIPSYEREWVVGDGSRLSIDNKGAIRVIDADVWTNSRYDSNVLIGFRTPLANAILKYLDKVLTDDE